MKPHFVNKASEELAIAQFGNARMATPMTIKNFAEYSALCINSYAAMGSDSAYNDVRAFEEFRAVGRLPENLRTVLGWEIMSKPDKFDLSRPDINFRAAVNAAIEVGTSWNFLSVGYGGQAGLPLEPNAVRPVPGRSGGGHAGQAALA